MADDRDDDLEVADDALDNKEPKSSRAWMALITQAKKVFDDYHERADNIDKQYANLERLANTTRDRQMQMFWANVAVLGPSIYARPPVPVVVPRFRDRKPILRVASELLERAAIVAFDIAHIDQKMRQVRDDLVVAGRGAVWLRYEASSKENDFEEHICVDFLNRRDLLHDPARTWEEVDWAARRAWMTRTEMRKRFKKSSGDAYKEATYEIRKDENGDDDGRLKAGVWEIWSKSQNKVVWVTENVDKLLDDDKPHLKLVNFFPCPKPAYATVQRGSLIPVPDMLFYKDQLEEINELTTRISSLVEAIRVRGFYPAGSSELGDAIEQAMKTVDDRATLIPIYNWSLLGNGSAKDTIVWLPIREVVEAVLALVNLRKQIIDDVYQITGLSDIMRGSTKPSETLGAQELKSQYGSIRVRDRQDELIRIARDVTTISAEIMAENFQQKTMLDMTQMEIPKNADVKKQKAELQKQIDGITRQIKQAQSDPEIMAMAQQQPDKAREVMGQAQQQIGALQGQMAELDETVTIEKVMELLRDQRARPFMLDIETDSTIAPDENAQKQRATEFITSVGGFMGQALPLIAQVPQAATLASEMLKYVASQFRAGREMQGVIEEFADQMKEQASSPKPDPAAAAAQAEAQAKQADAQGKMQERQASMAEKKADAERKDAEAKAAQEMAERKCAMELEAIKVDDGRKRTVTDIQVTLMREKRAEEAAQHQAEMEKRALDIEAARAKIAQTLTVADVAIAKAAAPQFNGSA